MRIEHQPQIGCVGGELGQRISTHQLDPSSLIMLAASNTVVGIGVQSALMSNDWIPLSRSELLEPIQLSFA